MDAFEVEKVRDDAETVIVEEAALIAAELMPVAVFLGWHWSEVRPDREIADGSS